MNYPLCFGLTAAICMAAAGDVVAQAANDQSFVTSAVQSGNAEIALGKMAVIRSSGETVVFAQQMVDDHTKAAAELKRIAGKAGAIIPSDSSPEQKTTELALRKLTGAAFVTKFAEVMVKDHEQAVDLFTAEAQSGLDVELKAFAAATLPTLQGHLKMSQDLRNAAK